MIRRIAPALAILALSIAVAVPVLAGGGGGGSKGSIAVRIKNVGVAPVAVNAKSGNVGLSQLVSSATTVAANGIAAYKVQAGTFTALAANPSAPLAVNKVRTFSTRNFKTIYLYAQQDTTAATLVGAPGGVKF